MPPRTRLCSIESQYWGKPAHPHGMPADSRVLKTFVLRRSGAKRDGFLGAASPRFWQLEPARRFSRQMTRRTVPPASIVTTRWFCRALRSTATRTKLPQAWSLGGPVGQRPISVQPRHGLRFAHCQRCACRRSLGSGELGAAGHAKSVRPNACLTVRDEAPMFRRGAPVAMAIYEYEILDSGGTVVGIYEAEQKMSDPALSHHPETGQRLRRILSATFAHGSRSHAASSDVASPCGSGTCGFGGGFDMGGCCGGGGCGLD